MFARNARWIAGSLGGVYILMVSAGLALQVSAGATWESFPVGVLIFSSVSGLLNTIIGAVIVWGHPRHPIGWIMCATQIFWGIDQLVFGYVYYGLIAHPGSLPVPQILPVWHNWTGAPFGIVSMTLLFLLFPDGQPLSPRWRRVIWISIAGLSILLPLFALTPGPIQDFPLLLNPIAVSETVWAQLRPLVAVSGALFFAGLPLAVISLFLRLRQARGDERQQIKWFAYAATFLPLAIPLLLTGDTGTVQEPNWIYLSGWTLQEVSSTGIALATAIAIFKYRLYDIDIIINKTLVYGALTATLALVYFMGVVLLQQVLPSESPISIVLSTLAIAALFSPLRRRIQNAIDRRFYRRRYDAQQTLTAFSEKMRDEVELENLSEALLAVVDETMQPVHASLWFRKSE
jgi:hypothetical protein